MNGREGIGHIHKIVDYLEVPAIRYYEFSCAFDSGKNLIYVFDIRKLVKHKLIILYIEVTSTEFLD
jgi:hypothetical protein